MTIAVAAILSTKTLEEAAGKCGVSVRTLKRWRAENADFKRLYEQATSDLLDRTMTELLNAGPRFAETLSGTVNDPNAPAGVRVTAARAGLDMLLRRAELQALEEKIIELERQGK